MLACSNSTIMTPVATTTRAPPTSGPDTLDSLDSLRRTTSDATTAAAAADDDAEHEVDDLADSKPKKKKRRVIKTGEKKYECPEAQCGKSYSRAEHLYRHQLNHTPKQIYYCDFPGCDRHFVRADLCARHKERHTAKGSHLQRKDAFLNAQRAEPNDSSSRPNSPPSAPTGATTTSNTTAGASPSDAKSSHRPVPPQHTHQRSSSSSNDHYLPPPPLPPPPPPPSAAPVLQPIHNPHDSNIANNYTSHPHHDLNPANPPDPATHLDPQLGQNGLHSSYPPVMNGNYSQQQQQQQQQHHTHHYPNSQPHPNDQQSSMMPPADRRYLAMDPPYPAIQRQNPPPYNPPPPSLSLNTMSSLTSPSPGPTLYQSQSYSSPSTNNFRSPNAYSTLPSLPPFGHPAGSFGHSSLPRPAGVLSPPAMSAVDQHPIANSRHNSLADFNAMDHFNSNGYAMPVFGSDYNAGFSRSPTLVMGEDWLQQLLGVSDPVIDAAAATAAAVAAQPSPPLLDPAQHLHMSNGHLLPKLEPDGEQQHHQHQQQQLQHPQQHHLGETQAHVPPQSHHNRPFLASGLDIDIRESQFSEQKRLRLIHLIMKRFNDPDDLADGPTRERILEGYDSDPNHVLGLHMLKIYLASFWTHIHQQMPILHRPTFNSETCPDLLLLAMICLGASCLERNHSKEQTKGCADMSFFLAYHIRWEAFKDHEFRPAAKLWTFQTMLFLELFEKMYSTRALHERAHVHHATTLTVMRRGSSLIGRCAANDNTPGGSKDPTRTPPGPDGTINTSGQNTPDATWNRWITTEATRRSAFAAFIIDSTHATLFGHAAIMSPHELKLPLPCDEALWAATSSAEVQRVEASLAANGFKPTTFIDGLKRTLNGQRVRTNTFGRVILMAGLLNVSWHMNQRDLQVSSLAAANTLGSQSKWRATLTRAFDFWRRDFDEGVSQTSASSSEDWRQLSTPPKTDSGRHDSSGGVSISSGSGGGSGSLDYRQNVLELRTCLHSLAHMAMHVDLVDCTVFAGSDRVVGRAVTDGDRSSVQRRMREQWAPSARARDSVFYALRFLCELLIPDGELAVKRANPSLQSSSSPFAYSARDDHLLNRPWTVFFAVLIVWTYGYALDGSLGRHPAYKLDTLDLQVFDMKRYLVHMGSVASPDDLEKLRDRNSCLGLLILLRQCFKEPRWELLQVEASDVLGNCIDMLLPGHAEIKALL